MDRDWAKAAAVVGGDKKLFQDIFRMLEASLEERFASLEAAIAALDWTEIDERAHQFKGALRNFGAVTAVARLQVIEDAGRKRTPLAWAEHIAGVRTAVDALCEAYAAGEWKGAFKA